MLSILTLCVLAAGVCIAYLQWRTNHQRVVLDLFDRRLHVFEDFESAVKNVFSTTLVTNETWALLLSAKARARFLFGDDVNNYIQQRIEDFAWRMTYTDETIDQDENRQDLIREKQEVLRRIIGFASDAEPLFSPYMKLEQRTPLWWKFLTKKTTVVIALMLILAATSLIAANRYLLRPTPSSPSHDVDQFLKHELDKSKN